jgi:hypothetical protein
MPQYLGWSIITYLLLIYFSTLSNDKYCLRSNNVRVNLIIIVEVYIIPLKYGIYCTLKFRCESYPSIHEYKTGL